MCVGGPTSACSSVGAASDDGGQPYHPRARVNLLPLFDAAATTRPERKRKREKKKRRQKPAPPAPPPQPHM